MARYSRKIDRAGRRRYLKAGLKNLDTSLKCSEALLKSSQDFSKNISGTVINKHSIAISIGLSIIEAVVPELIRINKKEIYKQKRRLR